MEQGAFISYSHADAQAARELVSIISKELNFPVWYDNNLHGGDHYFSIIAERILKYEYFIFLVSHNSVSSEFCTMELEFAKSEKRKILAIWLEDFMPPPRIRMVISHTHYVRTFALTPEGLRGELRQALLGDQLSTDGGEEVQVSDRILEGYKYFLRAEEKKKIQYLLQLEKQGKYSACYEPDAAVLLGIAYELGIHTEKNVRTAEYYYRIAAHKGSADGEYLTLALQMERGEADIPSAVKRMGQLADQGSLLAMVYWGEDLYNGRYHQRPDKETAYRWWRTAADRRHPEAQYYMAYGYRVGEVVEKDPLLAMMYAKESEESGFPRAHRLQGFLYRYGLFVEKDPDMAIACFRKAAEMGDYLSINYIGDVEWFRENHALAVEYYRQAVEHADAGRTKSGAPYYNLGFSYRKGDGIEKDSRKACELYLKGAQRGHANCKKWAALTIYYDLEDPEEKKPLLEEASRYDCRRAEFYMAKILETQADGRCAEALKWHELGVEKGDVDAMRYAMEYYSILSGPKEFRDREKALSVMRLFFSLWDSNQSEVEEKSGFTFSIAYYYQLYAFELAAEREYGKPDRSLSLFYIRKCLECENGTHYFGNFVALAWQYLSPRSSGTLAKNDPVAGLALAEVLRAYLDAFLDSDVETDKKKHRLSGMIDCMDYLEKQYNDSKSVLSLELSSKERTQKAQDYRDRAQQMRQKLETL